MTDQEKLDSLDAENQRRIQKIMSGQLGVQFQFPPSFFDFLKLTVYLEELLGPERAMEAKMAFAVKVSEVCDEIAGQINKAKLLAPGPNLDIPGVHPNQIRDARQS